MKRIFSIAVLVAFVCSLASAQFVQGPSVASFDVVPASQKVSSADYQRLQNLTQPSSQGSNRAIQNVELSYFQYADTIGTISSDSIFAFYWGINENFPNDSAFDFNTRWSAVVYDSLVDYNTLQSYPYPTVSPLELDSVDFFFRYENTTGGLDTIIFEIYVYDIATGIAGNDIQITNTPTFTDTLIVNATINANGLSVYTAVPPSPLQVSSTQRFATASYFKGDLANNFQVPASYNKPCTNACQAGEPIIDNSYYYLIFWSDTANLSGINPGIYYDCNFSGTQTPGACEEFPLHNFWQTSYVRFDDQLGGPQPTADFVGAPLTITAGQTVNFTDLSLNSPTAWEWEFAGAVTNVSTAQNPSGITYNVPGQYDVALIVSNAFGIDTLVRTNYITVNPVSSGNCDTLSNIFVGDSVFLFGISGLGGLFSGHNDIGHVSKADLFTNTGAGQVTSVDLALAVIASGGPSSFVTVSVWDTDGAAGSPGTILSSEQLLISDINTTGFTVVNFSSPANVTGDFYLGIQLNYGAGDTVGLIHSHDRAPGTAWEEVSAGNWFAFDDPAGTWSSDPEISFYIFPTVCPPNTVLNADFVANQTNITVGGSVNFTDLTAGTPTGWAWTFQGGAPASGSTQNPTNIVYNAAGAYDVTLIATDGSSFDTITKPGYIVVQQAGGPQLTCDTLTNIFTTDLPSIVGISAGWGYVSGHNSFLDEAKADLFTNPSPGSAIYEATIFFDFAYDGGNGSNVEVVVWDDDGAAGAPGTVLARQSVPLATIVADVNAATYRPTQVTFANPANPTGDFYLGVELDYAPGDTLAVLMAEDRDSTGFNSAWEQWDGGAWFTYIDGWGINTSHFIFPIQCDTLVCGTITGTITSGDATCTASNGSISAVGAGGTAPYSYSWGTSPIQTGPTASNLAAGSYTVTISDVDGCTGTASGTIGTTVTTITPNVTPQDATCSASDGSATASPSGGTQPYSFTWSSGGSAATETLLAAGTYQLTVSDANGCSVVTSVTVNASSGNLTASSSSTDATCTASNGTATVIPAGGQGPYTYIWSSGGNSGTESGLLAGSYTVTISDANSCTLVETVSVGTNNGTIASTTTTTPASCGASDGSATVNVTGATGAITYAWSSGGNAATETNLAAGTYTVTATDANGCETTNTATVVDPGSPQITQSGGSNVSCFGGSDGSVSINVTGGTAPYTYAWSAGISTTAVNSSLSAGTVSVTVTDQSGCTNSQTFTITEPSAAVVATLAGSTDLSCPGSLTGTVTVSATGGTTPYTYAWNTNPIQNTATATGLAAGTYTVTVADANGCTATTSGTVGAASNPISVSVNGAQTSACGAADATLTATVTGGAPTITYAWSSGSTANTAPNLSAGIYTVTVTDAGGCTATASGAVTDPGAHTVGVASTPVSCYNAGNGTITVTPSGGSGNYTYNWSPAVAGSSSSSATGLDGGTYNITVTDNVSNCVVPVTAVVSEPDSIDVTFTKTDVTCFGGTNGTITASASGGNGAPFTYTWQPSGTTGSILTGQSAGTVILQVTDANSCTKNVTVTIGQPAAINLAASKTDITCNGLTDGTATVAGSGGTGGFSYAWSTVPAQSGTSANGLGVGTYTVTATDGSGCTATQSVTISEPTAVSVTINGTDVSCAGGTNGSATATGAGGTGAISYSWSTNPTQAGQTASGLAAGGYSVTATDANGCVASETVTIGQPTDITLTPSATPVTCAGGSDGSASVSASGGTGTVTFVWGTSPTQSGATATGLTAGTYSVTATDANGCTKSTSVIVADGATVTASTSSTPVSCNGGADGTATVTPAGGTAAYIYSWSSGGNAATETGLSAGTVNFTVTDANGCSTNGSVVISEPSSITVTPNPVAATCNGGTDGAVNLTVSGGAGNYTYSWSNGTTNQNLSGVGAGSYDVTVTDGSGCSVSATSLTVNEASAITVTASATNETAVGANDGTATASATGGTGLVSFAWTGGLTGANQTGLAPGIYSVTATDINGCEAVETVEVSSFTGYADILALTNFEMYPNPTTGVVNMTIELTKPELVTVEWYNVIGERISNASYENVTVVKDNYDLSGMAEGMYFARVTVNGESFIRKVIVSK